MIVEALQQYFLDSKRLKQLGRVNKLKMKIFYKEHEAYAYSYGTRQCNCINCEYIRENYSEVVA